MNANSQNPRIYLDHAATSFPKAPGVVDCVSSYMTEVGASAGRGAYREAFEAKNVTLNAQEPALVKQLETLVKAVEKVGWPVIE